MARPKGSKDKTPRKPRLPLTLEHHGANHIEAPFGYTMNGIPRTKPRPTPKTPEGRKKLHDALVKKGLAKPLGTTVDKAGRPEKYIDPEQVKRLAQIDCTDSEIALIVGCHQSTISTRFRALIDEHRAHGSASLRRLQLRIAQGQEPERDEEGNIIKPFLAPNPQMAIHLGKHRLGQKDAPGTTNIALMGTQVPQGFQAPKLNPETARLLTEAFVRICPDPSRFLETREVKGTYEVQDA